MNQLSINSGFKKPWNRKKQGYHIDMTPYVDVIMLLLTFFIMTTVLEKPQVMQINLPSDTANVQVNKGNVIYLRISGMGNILISKGREDGSEEEPMRVDPGNLKKTLNVIGTKNYELIIMLKFHRKAKYDKMIFVLDEINNSNIEKRYSFGKIDREDEKIMEAMGG
jgi:biopolymer transport protein ExbD